MKTLLTNVAHSVMIVAAIASTSTIGNYLSFTHNAITSWALAIAFGGGLVSMSMILSKVDSNNKDLFYKMLLSVISFSLLSGTIQMLAYHHDGTSWVIAIVLGYSLPIILEVVIAIALSAYDEDVRQSKIRNAEHDLEDRAAIAMSDALANVNLDEIQHLIDEKLNLIVTRKVNKIVDKLVDNETPDVNITPDVNVLPLANVNPAVKPVNPPNVNTSTFERRKKLLTMLKSNYADVKSENVNKSEIARELNVTSVTINRDLTYLENNKYININGTINVVKEI